MNVPKLHGRRRRVNLGRYYGMPHTLAKLKRLCTRKPSVMKPPLLDSHSSGS